jgi:hypothetical protein
MLRQEDGSAFVRVCATSRGARDRTRNIREDEGSGECDWVKDACLVVVSYHNELGKGIQKIGHFRLTNEYATTGEDMEEGVEIVWICSLEPVKVDRRIATGDLRDNLKRRVRWEPGAKFATHNEDAAIGKNNGARIPTSSLKQGTH